MRNIDMLINIPYPQQEFIVTKDNKYAHSRIKPYTLGYIAYPTKVKNHSHLFPVIYTRVVIGRIGKNGKKRMYVKDIPINILLLKRKIFSHAFMEESISMISYRKRKDIVKMTNHEFVCWAQSLLLLCGHIFSLKPPITKIIKTEPNIKRIYDICQAYLDYYDGIDNDLVVSLKDRYKFFIEIQKLLSFKKETVKNIISNTLELKSILYYYLTVLNKYGYNHEESILSFFLNDNIKENDIIENLSIGKDNVLRWYKDYSYWV